MLKRCKSTKKTWILHQSVEKVVSLQQKKYK